MHLIAPVVVALTVAVATPALAQEDHRARARELFRQGEEHLAAKRYDEAVAAYQAAYDLAPLPALLYNIGQAHRLGGHVDEAIAAYEKYLAVEPNGKASKEARAHLEKLRKERAARPRPIEPVVEPDAAEREHEAPTYRETAPPEEADREPAVAAPPPPRERDDRAPSPRRAGSGLRIAGWTAAGVGLLALGVGGYYAKSASDLADDVTMQDDGAWTQSDDDLLEKGEAANRNAIIGFAAGGALIVTGAVLLYLGYGADDTPAVAVTPTTSGFVVAGTF